MCKAIELCSQVVLLNIIVSIVYLHGLPVDVDHDTRPILDAVHPLEEKV